MKSAPSFVSLYALIFVALVACQTTNQPVSVSDAAAAPMRPSRSSIVSSTDTESAKPAISGTARNIANNCFTCHGPDGKSPGAIPGLGRLSAEQIAARLRSFKNGTASSTIMGRHVKAYTDAEIDAVAAYIAGLNQQAKP